MGSRSWFGVLAVGLWFVGSAQAQVGMARRNQLLPDHRLLHASAEQGLLIIDICDPKQPRVEGVFPVGTTALGFHLVGDRVILPKQNGGYSGARTDARVPRAGDAGMMSVDISDRTRPRLVGELLSRAGERFVRSVLIRRADRIDLYVVWKFADSPSTGFRIERVDVTAGRFDSVEELALPDGRVDWSGDVFSDGLLVMLATPDWLVFPSSDMHASQSPVSIVDISGDSMIERNRVTAHLTTSSIPMAVDGGLLRVATPFEIETFDPRAPSQSAQLGTCKLAYGSGPVLFDLLGRAFASNNEYTDLDGPVPGGLTNYVLDPSGACEVYLLENQSAWGLRLGPAGRLFGFHSDSSIAMFDTSNVQGPPALIGTAPLAAPLSWAQLTVVDDKVSAIAPDGTLETGLVNVQNWYGEINQLVTFSDRTITARGVVESGASFVGGSDLFFPTDSVGLIATDSELTTFDRRNLNSPTVSSRFELQPRYGNVFTFGDYVVRIRVSESFTDLSPYDEIQVLPLAATNTFQPPIARLSAPGGGLWFRAGDLLVQMVVEVGTTHAVFRTFDLTDPQRPRPRGVLETDAIQDLSQGIVVGKSLVFGHGVFREQAQSARDCVTLVDGACKFRPEGCPAGNFLGIVNCTTQASAPTECHGSIRQCDDAYLNCVPTTAAPTYTQCRDVLSRTWISYELDVVDLRNPERPLLAQNDLVVDDIEGQRLRIVPGASSLIAAGDALYVNGESLPGVDYPEGALPDYFVYRLDLTDPSNPRPGPVMHVPGRLLAVVDSKLYAVTSDPWGTGLSTVYALEVEGSIARTLGSRELTGSQFETIGSDGAGHVLATIGRMYNVYDSQIPKLPARLQILDGTTVSLLAELELDIDTGAAITHAGRALFPVAGGFLLVDVRNPAEPQARAILPGGQYQPVAFDNGRIILSVGVAGGWNFPIDTVNIGTP